MVDQERGQGLSIEELQTLLIAGQGMSQEKDPERICRWACDAVTSLLGTSLAAIILETAERTDPPRVFGRMGDSPLAKSAAGDLASLASAAWLSSGDLGEVTVLKETDLPPRPRRGWTGSLARIPVHILQRRFGLLVAAREADWELGTREEFVLSTLAHQVARSLENALQALSQNAYRPLVGSAG